MATLPKSMNIIKQVLTGHKNGLSVRRLADMYEISPTTVQRYIGMAKADPLGLDALLLLEDPELNHRFNGGNPAYCDERFEDFKSRLPHFEQELKRKHMTVQLLWEDYQRTTRPNVIEMSNLYRFLKSLYPGTHEAFKRYEVGYDGRRTMFRYLDVNHRLRQIKAMAYCSGGHRDKSIYPLIYRKQPQDGQRAELVYFGEHLLARHPDFPVAVVESEKTAIIASMEIQGVIWLATGSKSNLNALSERSVLNGRDVTLYPDADAIADWRKIAQQHHWHDASLLIPDYEDLLTAIAPTADIADYFVSKSESTRQSSC